MPTSASAAVTRLAHFAVEQFRAVAQDEPRRSLNELVDTLQEADELPLFVSFGVAKQQLSNVQSDLH
jgi:hypothetical protein